MHLDLETHTSLADLRGFLAGNPDDSVQLAEREQAYAHIGKVLRRFSYWRLGRADKGLLQRYLARTTSLSRAQFVEFQIDSCGIFRIISCCSGEIFQVDSLLQEGVKGNLRRCGWGSESTAGVFRK